MKDYHPRVLELVGDEEYIEDRLESADRLMEKNVLYIVHSKPDDNSFKHVEYSKHSEWCCKLRGNKTGPSYLHNAKNGSDWFRGYVYSPESDSSSLEQLLVFDVLQGNITMERVDLVEFRSNIQAKQDAHFEGLFSFN